MNKESKGNKKIRNYKITAVRLGILFAFFMFLSFGGYYIGPQSDIILPVFHCRYVAGGTTEAFCLMILDFNKYMSETFVISMLACLVLIMLFGTLWCGYVCPVGFFQDIITEVRQRLGFTQLNISQKFKPVLTILKWFLVFYILFYDLCKVCPIFYFTVPLTGYVQGGDTTAFYWAIGLFAFMFISDRFFCRICPIGAFLGLFNKISGSRLKKKGSACTHCRACLEVCPVDIQEIYEDRENEDITNSNCIYCMKCIEVCPEKDALRFELFGKTILKSKRPTDSKCDKNKNGRGTACS